SRRLGGRDFWSSLPELTRALVSRQDGKAFLKAYAQLIRLLLSYLVGNTIQLVVSFSPVVATVLLAGPVVMEHYNRGASELTIYPPRPILIESAGKVFSTNAAGSAIAPVPDFEGTGRATSDRGEFGVRSLWRNTAWCTTAWGRIGMALLGFETLPADG